jgi:hypothetical protein
MVHHTQENVTMATLTLSSKMQGYCFTDITLKGNLYSNVKLYILPNLCAEVILGQNWQAQHESVIKVCGLTALDVDPPPLFEYLTADCKPIAARSRRYSYEDRAFITAEIQRLQDEGVIEPSDSPWRSKLL